MTMHDERWTLGVSENGDVRLRDQKTGQTHRFGGQRALFDALGKLADWREAMPDSRDYGVHDPTGAYADMCSQLPSCHDGEHSESCEVSIYRVDHQRGWRDREERDNRADLVFDSAAGPVGTHKNCVWPLERCAGHKRPDSTARCGDVLGDGTCLVHDQHISACKP